MGTPQALFVLAIAAAMAVPMPLCAQDVPDDFVITLERHGISCGGPCPTYTVTINARGDVTYQGTMFVRVEGTVTDSIPMSSVNELVSTVERIRFFELRDRYVSLRGANGTEVIVTDLLTTFVSVTRNGQTKRIKDFIGSPEGLRELERQIESAARTQRWVRIDVATLRQMVEAGHPPSADERQMLLRAALFADEVDVIQALLAMGADPNVSPGDDHYGPTRPLIIVRSAAAARALIDAGADVSTPDEYMQTPMRTAAGLRPDVAEVLLKAGAPVDPVDHVGATPLMHAALAGNAGVVRLLLSAGANPAYSGEHGTALDFARGRKEEVEQRRQRLLPEISVSPFVPDFDGVIEALERATRLR